DDQVAAVVAAVDAAPGRPMVVDHSAACTLAWLAADARPERVAKVGLIGGSLAPEGERYADYFECKDGLMPFPGWEPYEGPATAAVDAARGRPMVVGHAAACTLAWLAAVARPGRVAKVVLIGGSPAPDGERYADYFECKDGVMPFPGWEPYEGPDTADLDEEA